MLVSSATRTSTPAEFVACPGSDFSCRLCGKPLEKQSLGGDPPYLSADRG